VSRRHTIDRRSTFEHAALCENGYNLWTSPSRRGPGVAQPRGVVADHRVWGSPTNGGGRSGVRLSRHRGPQRAQRALSSYNRRWTKTAITFMGVIIAATAVMAPPCSAHATVPSQRRGPAGWAVAFSNTSVKSMWKSRRKGGRSRHARPEL